jgi:replicative DNA helicase
VRGLEFLVSIIYNGNPSELRLVDESWFVGQDELASYNYCLRHVIRYSRLPTIETLEEETGVAMPEAEDSVAYYLDALTNRKFYGDIREPYQALRNSITDQNMEDARSVISELAGISRTTRTEVDLANVGEAGVMALERYYTNQRRGGMIGVPSGWAAMDEQTAGFQGGDLIAYVARPETGKTWLMLQQIRAAHAQGCNVLMATMEMPIVALANRYYSLVAGINPRDLRHGRLSSYELDRLRMTVDSHQNDDMFAIYQANMGTGLDGLESVVAERRPDVVFIDGVYMMKAANSRRGAAKNESVSDVLDGLKELALRRDCPVVITSQLNREGKGKSGNLENVGYSDTFGTHCSLIFKIEKPDRSARDTETRIITSIKGREGENVTMAVHYKFSPTVDFTQTSMADVVDTDTDGANLDWMV